MNNDVLMHVVIEKNIASCERLWEQFSPKKTLWELWGTVYSQYDETLQEPCFLVIKENETVLGVLPLWKDLKTGQHLYFGGEYIEDIFFWIDHSYLPFMFSHLPGNTVLYDIHHAEAEALIQSVKDIGDSCHHEQNHYFIDLEKISYSVPNHLLTFTKKHRKNLLYDMRKIENEELTKVWTNKTVYYQEFVDFCMKRWGDESDFVDPAFVIGMEKFLLFLEKENLLLTLAVLKDNRLVGVEYGAFYNNIYSVLNGGYDVTKPNIGKYLIMQHLEKAAALKARMVDFLSGDNGWKELWNCEKVPYYTLRHVPKHP